MINVLLHAWNMGRRKNFLFSRQSSLLSSCRLLLYTLKLTLRIIKQKLYQQQIKDVILKITKPTLTYTVKKNLEKRFKDSFNCIITLIRSLSKNDWLFCFCILVLATKGLIFSNAFAGACKMAYHMLRLLLGLVQRTVPIPLGRYKPASKKMTENWNCRTEHLQNLSLSRFSRQVCG